MLVAINTKYRYNKEKDENKLSSDWQINELSHDELEEHLLKGYPITNIYNKDITGFRRIKEHFSSASFIPLDFDNNPDELIMYNAEEFRVEELTSGPSVRAKFIKENAYIGYLTYSHTTANNRFRILFKLPYPITNLNEYIKTYKAFLYKFPSADHEYVISTGFVWGAKKNTAALKLGNELTKETLETVLQDDQEHSKNKIISNQNKTLTRNDLSSGKQVESKIYKYLTELNQAKLGNRMNTLNKDCYSIGGLISYYELSQTDEECIKAEIRKIAYKLGSITHFESFTKKDINTAIEKSIIEGKEKPLKINNNGNRLFKNLPKNEYFQFPQQISTNYPSPEYINGISNKKIIEVEKTQIVNFGKFSINNDGIIDKVLIVDIFDVLKDNEAFKDYLALWEYANIKNTINFDIVEINEIIKIAHPDLSKQEMYRQREKFKSHINKLFTVSLFRKTKINDIELEEGIHLIDKLLFITNRNRIYISYKLPETFGRFGSYLPYSLNKLTGNEKGATNLAIALFKEAFRINGFERLKKDNRDFIPPENLLPVKWSKERVFKEIRTINNKNITERNNLLDNILTRLEEINLIKRFNIQETRVEFYLKL